MIKIKYQAGVRELAIDGVSFDLNGLATEVGETGMRKNIVKKLMEYLNR